MKYYLLLILLVPLLFCMFSCGPDPITQRVTLIVDQTEEYFQHVSLDEFRRVSALTRNELNGETTRIVQITESAFNPVARFSIEPVANKWFDNEIERRKQAAAYYDAIKEALTIADTAKRERPASAVYQIIASELTPLSSSDADERTLVVNSDLMELSSIANFYDAATFQLLTTSPDSIEESFVAVHPLPSLNGISVHLIYQPLSRADSERFSIVAAFYQRLLGRHGASVTVGANLLTNN